MFCKLISLEKYPEGAQIIQKIPEIIGEANPDKYGRITPYMTEDEINEYQEVWVDYLNRDYDILRK